MEKKDFSFKKWGIIIVSSLIVLVFAFFGVSPSFFGDISGGGAALTVGEQTISLGEYENLIRSMERSQKNSIKGKSTKERRAFLRNLRLRALEELVQVNAVYQLFLDHEYVIAKRAVVDEVLKEKAFYESGVFKRSRYEALLKQIGQTPSQFETNLTKNLVFQRVSRWMRQSLNPLESEQVLKDGVLGVKFLLRSIKVQKLPSIKSQSKSSSASAKSKKKAIESDTHFKNNTLFVGEADFAKLKKWVGADHRQSMETFLKKYRVKKEKHEEQSLLSDALPVVGKNDHAYAMILDTTKGAYVKEPFFSRGAYYFFQVVDVKTPKAQKRTSKNKSAFNFLSRWIASQRYQGVMTQWLKQIEKDIPIRRNRNLYQF